MKCNLSVTVTKISPWRWPSRIETRRSVWQLMMKLSLCILLVISVFVNIMFIWWKSTVTVWSGYEPRFDVYFSCFIWSACFQHRRIHTGNTNQETLTSFIPKKSNIFFFLYQYFAEVKNMCVKASFPYHRPLIERALSQQRNRHLRLRLTILTPLTV
jgi:hypothetical protein